MNKSKKVKQKTNWMAVLLLSDFKNIFYKIKRATWTKARKSNKKLIEWAVYY